MTSASKSPSHGLPLVAIAGNGSGIVNVTANARGGFTANTRDAINVHGVRPDTVLYVRAAADVGMPDGQQADGVCQRAALGQFQPLLAYPGGPPAILETSPGGAGATHVVFGITNPFVPEGGSLDLVLRLVDALPPATPTIDCEHRASRWKSSKRAWTERCRRPYRSCSLGSRRPEIPGLPPAT